MQIKTAHKNSNRYVYSFGTNVYGELGRPTSSGLLAHLPERVECDAFTFVALAASRHCSVAITGPSPLPLPSPPPPPPTLPALVSRLIRFSSFINLATKK